MIAGACGASAPPIEEARALWSRLAAGTPCAKEKPDAGTVLSIIEPLLGRCGITRVGDLTGLDTVGIPVWFASRPNARALSLGQGKDLTACQARISAIMEAMEGFAAERTRPLIACFGSTNEMQRTSASMLLPLTWIPRVDAARLDPDRERAWVAGISLRDGRPLLAPYELVGLDMRSDMPWDHLAFSMDSVGLGAGIDLEQAALHALLEVIENDAVAPLELFGPMRPWARPLRYDAGESLALDEAMGKLADAQVAVHFVHCAGPTPLPTVGAYVGWPALPARARWCSGFACRPDPLDAALAALLEAVQARATNIAGARDDIAPGDYAAVSRWRFAAPDGAGSIGELGQGRGAGGEARRPLSLGDALRMTFGAGVRDVGLFPLGVADTPVRVVRIVATDLWGSPRQGVMPFGLGMLAGARSAGAAA